MLTQDSIFMINCLDCYVALSFSHIFKKETPVCSTVNYYNTGSTDSNIVVSRQEVTYLLYFTLLY